MRYFVNKFADYKAGSEVVIDRVKWKKYCESIVNTIFEKFPPCSDSCDGDYTLAISVWHTCYIIYRNMNYFKTRKQTT